jgi:hypothetical protein
MIDKLTPRILQTSKDQRAMEPTEMLDALNITVTGDEEGGAGVLKNIKGTENIPSALNAGFPEGENVIIGSTKDETLGVAYFFVWNSLDSHGVYAYSSKSKMFRLIFQDPSLNFDRNGFVKADVVRIKRPPEDKGIITFGCTSPSSPNYDPEAMFDDGSCQVGGYDDDTDVGVEGVDYSNTPPPWVTPIPFNVCDYLDESELADDAVSNYLGSIYNINAAINSFLGTNILSNIDAISFTEEVPMIWLEDNFGNPLGFDLVVNPDNSLMTVNQGQTSMWFFSGDAPSDWGCVYTPDEGLEGEGE